MANDNPWGGIADQVNKTGDAPLNAELTRAEPTAAELDNYVPPNTRSAQYRTGVQWCADYETLDDGMCRHARLQARALYDFGVATRLQSINHTVRIGKRRDFDPLLHLAPGPYQAAADVMDPEVLRVVKPMMHLSISSPLVTVRQGAFLSERELLAHAIPRYAQMEPQRIAGILGQQVVYLPWERSTLDEKYAHALNRFGQVWVQSSRHLKIFAEAGVQSEKIWIMPNAIDTSSRELALGGSGAPFASGKRFYHIGKWEPRKNQHLLLGAFLMAFGPKDAASLMIKTHPFGTWADYPSPPESKAIWLAHPAVKAKGWTAENLKTRVRITDVTLEESELHLLHRNNNIYVSSGAGEAWDYPAFDAKLSGNRLVYVGFGGPEDYATDADVQVPWEFGPVHPGYSWGKNAQWAEYPVEALRDALLRAQVPKIRQTGVRDRWLFHIANIGSRMARALAYLCGAEGRNLDENETLAWWRGVGGARC